MLAVWPSACSVAFNSSLDVQQDYKKLAISLGMHDFFNYAVFLFNVPTYQRLSQDPVKLTSLSTSTMATAAHAVESLHHGWRQHAPSVTGEISSSALKSLAAELLVEVAKSLDEAEDLQNLRLANRAFSKAATTACQDRFVRIHLLPTRPSMARFLRLATNNLIAAKILQIVVIYAPPFTTTVMPTCQRIGKLYGIPWNKLKNIVSEFNDMCIDPETSRMLS